MKTAALELNSSVPNRAVAQGSVKARAGAYLELTKPRITSLIMLTSAAGFVLASRGPIDYFTFVHAMIGIGLLGELQVRHFHTASHRAPYAIDRILRLRSEESLLQ